MFRAKFVQIRGPFALPLILLMATVILPLVLVVIASFIVWAGVARLFFLKPFPGFLSRNTILTKKLKQAQARAMGSAGENVTGIGAGRIWGAESSSESESKPDIEVQGRRID